MLDGRRVGFRSGPRAGSVGDIHTTRTSRKIRIVIGLLAAVLGTAWWAGNIGELWTFATDLLPFAMIAVALVAVARTFVPYGSLAGPAVLLAIGTGWLLLRYEVLPGPGTILPIALISGGFVVALGGEDALARPDRPRNLVYRRSAFLVPSRPVELTGNAPGKVSVRAVLASLTIDLRATDEPVGLKVVDLDITVLLRGKVEVVVPSGWIVHPGRIHARHVRFDGRLDSAVPVVTPGDLRIDDVGPIHVLVNVLGLMGKVALRRA